MELMQSIITIKEIAQKFDFENIVNDSRKLIEFSEYSKQHIVIIGEFNRGKSTLTNSLIGKNILPMGIVPTTAKIWHIEQGEDLKANVVLSSGEKENLAISKESLDKLSAEGSFAENVKFIDLKVPNLLLGSQAVIIDTPGVNDINQQRAEITYNFLQMADAAIFLLDAASPLTKSEADFLKGQVLEKHLNKILFVLNKIDRLDEDEIEDSLDAAKERLQEILGFSPHIVTCDSSQILSAIENDQIEVANRWGLNSLQSSLVAMLDSEKHLENKRKMVFNRLRSLKNRLLETMNEKRTFLSLNSEERALAIIKVQDKEKNLAKDLEKLEKYILIFGRDQLKAMISQSLKQIIDEIIQVQKTKILSMNGDFERYATVLFPNEFQVTFKRWFEQKANVINKFLKDFVSKVSKEFNKKFKNQFYFACMDISRPEGINLPNGDFENKFQANDTLIQGLPVAGLLLSSILIGGPFAIVGMYAGRFLSTKLKKEETDQIRETLLQEIPACVEKTSFEFQNKIFTNIDSWFDKLVDGVKENYKKIIQEEIKDKISENQKSQEDINKIVSSLSEDMETLKGLT
jgi:small GTP-binding protein